MSPGERVGEPEPRRQRRSPPREDATGEPCIQDYMRRFLNVFFYPFWWLLLLPALSPVAYPYIPTTFPTKLSGWTIPSILPEGSDIENNLFAWLAGILIWGLGASTPAGSRSGPSSR